MASSKNGAAVSAIRLSALVAYVLVLIPVASDAQEDAGPDLEGMWIEGASAFADPRWRLEDLICYGCTRAAFGHLDILMAQDEERSLTEYTRALAQFDREYIYGLMTEAGRRYFDEEPVAPDPGCEPIGLIQHLRTRLSVNFEEFEGGITLQYEYLGSTRTVHMDGRDHPADLQSSLLGHSIGWYDGSTLVVETVGLEPTVVRSSGIFDPVRISERARVIERYTRNPGESWYDYEATLVDPKFYREPFVVHHQRRLLEYDQVFEVYDCQVVSGEF